MGMIISNTFIAGIATGTFLGVASTYFLVRLRDKKPDKPVVYEKGMEERYQVCILLFIYKALFCFPLTITRLLIIFYLSMGGGIIPSVTSCSLNSITAYFLILLFLPIALFRILCLFKPPTSWLWGSPFSVILWTVIEYLLWESLMPPPPDCI